MEEGMTNDQQLEYLLVLYLVLFQAKHLSVEAGEELLAFLSLFVPLAMAWRFLQRSPLLVPWSIIPLPVVVSPVSLSVLFAEVSMTREVCIPDYALLSGLQTTPTDKSAHVVIHFLLAAA